MSDTDGYFWNLAVSDKTDDAETTILEADFK